MRNCIQTENLQPGMVIVQVTKQNGPLKIRKAGLVTSVEMIQGLLEMGIQEVQIDPDQTVEIETPAVQSSATIQLLQSNSGVLAKAAHQSHDQFNRSLFLPSVQDIPSQWQFYAKRVATLTLFVVFGLTLGFGVAYLSSLLALRSPIVIVNPVTDIDEKLATPVVESADVTSKPVAQNPVAKLDQEHEQNYQPPPKPVTQSVTKSAEPTSRAEKSIDTEDAVLQAKETEHVLTQTPPENSEPLSPELVKRFEKVMQQMDREERYAGKNTQLEAAEQNTEQSQPIVDLSEFPILDEQQEVLSEQGELLVKQQALTNIAKERNLQDVPRIDQLPDWVVAELPSMAFSAHMYASLPSERWVRVNGQNMHEGDLIDNKVRIMQIAPQHVILNYAGYEFSMQAMTDW